MNTSEIEWAWAAYSASHGLTWGACEDGIAMIRDYPEFWENEPLSTLVDRVQEKRGYKCTFQACQ